MINLVEPDTIVVEKDKETASTLRNMYIRLMTITETHINSNRLTEFLLFLYLVRRKWLNLDDESPGKDIWTAMEAAEIGGRRLVFGDRSADVSFLIEMMSFVVSWKCTELYFTWFGCIKTSYSS